MPTFPTTITVDVNVLAGLVVPTISQIGTGLTRYYVTVNQIGGPATTMIAFKSIDGGDTWNQVGGVSPAVGFGLSNSVIDGNGVIWCVNADNSILVLGPLQFVGFDTNTDTWGALITSAETMNVGATSVGVCYRGSDNSLVVMGVITNDATDWRCGYVVFDIVSETTAATVPCGFTGVGAVSWENAGFVAQSTLKGNGFTHFIFLSGSLQGQPPQATELSTQSLSDGGSLSAVQTVDSDPGALSNPGVYGSSDGLTVVIAWDKDPVTPGTDCTVWEGVSQATLTLTPTVINLTVSTPSSISIVKSLTDGFTYLVATDGVDVFYHVDQGSGFGASIPISSAPGDLVIAAQLNSTPVAFVMAGSVLYWEITGTPPVIAALTQKRSTGGGAFFPRFLNKSLLNLQLSHQYAPLSSFYGFPNEFDLCLTQDWTLYDRIDREALSCGRKPECFCVDEREWIEIPKGGVTFNPVNSIPLPDPADGNVVVVSFRVPFAYDGAILGQFNSVNGGFNEGSGDIVWRLRVDGRYLKDCGKILVTLGSGRELSPVYGGLLLRSGNLVEYVVSAPNTGGSLPAPGSVNVLAGLHGWHYPRSHGG